ncbi:rCG30450 [Rattus norvegicus]|uniref:Proto-oncogene serine/threonine-protein kinase mos n=1 Tax=Rattus norvegicus TaxID=10116 RepID=A6JFL7_RAT|nr:rCG30450 [Rattus norvegicus]
MPSPLILCRYLPRELSPTVDSRSCSSPLVASRKAGKFLGATPPRAPRLSRRLAWCFIDWGQVCLLHRLGSGGFGSVYKATYHGVPVAIKQVNKCTRNLRASQRSFWAELNIARLHHDNIVRVVAASTRTPEGSNSLGTIIMEFGGNVTLHQVIYGATRSPEPLSCREQLSLGKCLKYSLDIVNGLLFLHSQSILHLDLKPANILISEKDVCKISDFGCSQKLQDLRSGAPERRDRHAQSRHLLFWHHPVADDHQGGALLRRASVRAVRSGSLQSAPVTGRGGVHRLPDWEDAAEHRPELLGGPRPAEAGCRTAPEGPEGFPRGTGLTPSSLCADKLFVSVYF